LTPHWNGEGRNTHIPDQPDRPNKARRIRVWPNDISIWVHQRFEDPPALASVEGGAFRDLRSWARRFYPELRGHR